MDKWYLDNQGGSHSAPAVHTLVHQGFNLLVKQKSGLASFFPYSISIMPSVSLFPQEPEYGHRI